nr:TPR domain containing protein, putative [Ipomoea batatas]
MKEAEREAMEMEDSEERMQQLRSKATELLLTEEWEECTNVYSQFISLCNSHISKLHQNPSSDHLAKLQRSLCLALSNRAESHFRLRQFPQALRDCDDALKIDTTHLKSLLCKGKILLALNRYAAALDCFRAANLDVHDPENAEILNEYIQKCKSLEALSRTGGFDLSNWALNRFCDKVPDLAEYVGAVEIRKSEISGRGLFATKNVESGTLLLVTRAIAIERGIMPQSGNHEDAQLVIWKNFVDKVIELTSRCNRTWELISKLSVGENEDSYDVPELDLFRPEADDSRFSGKSLDMKRILGILDVNSLVEEAVSAKVLGKNSHYHGIGLWLLASFINHSCDPNVRRLHIGDYILVHASRDIKAGEELTFAYFDVLSPFSSREGWAKNWGFSCKCRRCEVECGLYSNQELQEIQVFLEKGLDMGEVVYRLEEGMRRWMVKGKAKGYLRASFWGAYSEVFESDKLRRKWGSKIPAMDTVVDSVVNGVGSDERIVKVVMRGLKRSSGHGGGGVLEMEKAMKLGRGLYGKIMKKQALKSLLQFDGLS